MTSSSLPRLLVARRILARPTELIEDGGLLVVGGRIVELLSGSGPVRRAASRWGLRPRELEADVVTPGLVNAHAHLELSVFRARLSGRGLGEPSTASSASAGAADGPPFVAWIRSLLDVRGEPTEAEWQSAAMLGAQRLLATGTTSVGDIASLDFGDGVALDAGLRSTVYREVLDAWDTSRTQAALGRVRRALPKRARRREGLSPHAPYTTSPELLRRSAALAKRRRLPIACHWSETQAEVDWMRGRPSAFEDLLGRPGPNRSALDLLEEAGLLGPATMLVHGNAPEPDEPQRIARAGCSVVHCPGTHAFFGRAPFPWRTYLQAGVPLALGTDSLASNGDLDLAAEMRRAREAAPELAAEVVWTAATEGGARALGQEGSLGRLAPEACADWVGWTLDARRRDDLLEGLTTGRAEVAHVAVAGRRVALEGRGTGSAIESSEDLP